MECLKLLGPLEMNKYISLINGKLSNSVSVLDRGLSYGDGLFETMSYCYVKKKLAVEFWERHLKRLRESCLITKIKFPSNKLLLSYKKKILHESLIRGMQSGILKIIITRGIGGRGYKYDKSIKPTIIFLSFPRNQIKKKLYENGVEVRFCKSSIFSNASLAGLKHLNRMDSVLARAEWDKENYFEGVMVDDSQNIIDGTMTNIFFSKDNILYTPCVKKSGINGIMRQVIIDKSKLFFDKICEVEIKKESFIKFDEMFITNSVIKILPVKALRSKKFKISDSTKRLIELFLSHENKIQHLELS